MNAATKERQSKMGACPSCGASGFRKIEDFDRYAIKHCSACDLVYSDPMLSLGSRWYEQEYADTNKLNRFLPVSPFWWHEQFLGSKKLGADLMDIGCASGIFLSEAQKMGYKVCGLDFNSDSLKTARERYGLKEVYNSSVEDFFKNNPGRAFDVVTFFEVLEHLERPDEFIAQVRKILKPGGHIAVSVPNRNRYLDSLGKGDYPPHHLTRWSETSLKKFLESSGFKVVDVRVQRLTLDDIAFACTQGLLKYAKKNLAERASKAQEGASSPGIVHRKYAMLKKAKNMVMRVVFAPLYPFVKLYKPQGWDIYCLAVMPSGEEARTRR